MKCFNCNKFIPDVSEVCPYCNNLVDSNKENVIDFGNIDNTSYNSGKFDIKVYIKEPKNRKVVFGALALIVLVIIIFISLVASMFFKSSEPDYKVFTRVVAGISEYLEENYIGSKYSSSGKYRLTLKVNNDSVAFDGNYGYDVKNKIVNLTGSMRDPKEQTGEVLIDTKDLVFNAYMKDNNIYFQSNQIYGDEYLFFPIEDTSGLLKTKNYDLYSLVIGTTDAMDVALKQMNYKTESASITYLGKEKNVTKRSLILDNQGKLKFIKSFFTELKEDVNFVNEMARIKDKKDTDIIKTIENYITTSEYKYSSNSTNKTTVSIYFTSSKVYRIEVLVEEDELPLKYIFDIGETKYYLDYFEGDKNVYSLTFASKIKELENLTEKNYDITIDTDDYVTDLNIYLEEDKQTKVKKQDIETFKNIKDFTEEDYIKVKSNTSYYLKDITFIDKIRDYYKEKCTPDLNCVCNDSEENCSCTYNDRIISCPANLVKALESAE